MSTGINYLDETWSPVTGCQGKNCPTKDTCWARAWVKWRPAIHGITQGLGGSWAKDDFQPERIPFNQPQFHPDRLEKPLHWKKPRRIGVCFMGDLFDEQVPDEWILKILDIMEFVAQQHTYFVLTKQADRMAEFMRGYYEIDNIYWGISITSQADADRMIPELLRIPGKRWISYEPAIGPIKDFPLDHPQRTAFSQIDFFVLGSHNRPKLYPCPHEWMISVVDQCKAARTPCFVKQVEIDEKVCHNITQFPKALQVRELP